MLVGCGENKADPKAEAPRGNGGADLDATTSRWIIPSNFRW